MRYRSLAVAVILGALAVPSGSGALTTAHQAANPGQAFFHDALIADSKTSQVIRDGLKSKALIVDPATQYANLTADNKSDAVVRVHSTGAAGVIAVYVFSTDGDSKGTLRVVFRSQQLSRAITGIESGNRLRIDTPKYAPGDSLCCPANLTRREYAWSNKSKTFRRTLLTTVKNA